MRETAVQTATADMAKVSARERFQALLGEHAAIVHKVAAMYCRNPADRLDLGQEIAIQAWRSFAGYDPQRPFSTWLYRLALNVAISHARSSGLRQRHTVAFEADLHDCAAEDHAAAEPDERLLALQRCIDALGPLDRALMLLYLEERSYAQIAEVLGITATNVATKINRLKQRIRNELTGEPA